MMDAHSDELRRRQFPANKRQKVIDNIMQEVCAEGGVNIAEIRSGSRRVIVSKARREIATRLVNAYGTPISEVAGCVGVTAAAVSKMINSATNKLTK